MKYGESVFDILYLLFAIVSGCVILSRSKERAGKLMGLAALLLAAGVVPMLGMLMLPKTVCYILMICAFHRSIRGTR